MKKTLLLLSLSLVFFLPGCGGGGSAPTCSNTFTAGTTVRIYYTHPYYPTTIILERTAPAGGVITVPTYGYQCYNLIWVIVTNANATLAASPSSIYLPSPPSTANSKANRSPPCSPAWLRKTRMRLMPVCTPC